MVLGKQVQTQHRCEGKKRQPWVGVELDRLGWSWVEVGLGVGVVGKMRNFDSGVSQPRLGFRHPTPVKDRDFSSSQLATGTQTETTHTLSEFDSGPLFRTKFTIMTTHLNELALVFVILKKDRCDPPHKKQWTPILWKKLWWSLLLWGGSLFI